MFTDVLPNGYARTQTEYGATKHRKHNLDSGHFARLRCENAVPISHDSEAARTERKFNRLRDEWKAKRGHSSSSVELAMHPAYLKIIGMGWDAVPFLLQELKNEPDLWFLALRSITDENPVTDEIRGNIKAMSKAWLTWAEERGLE